MATFPTQDSHRLIEGYRSYAHAIAAEMLRKFPPAVDKDDVIGAAELGLVEAAQRYDPSRGVVFKTYAYYRIRGAIYDAMRKMGWLQKSVPSLRFEAAANEYLKDYTSGGAVDESSNVDGFGDLQNLASALTSCYVLSLESLPAEPADPSGTSPEESCSRAERRAQLHRALTELPTRNRELIEEYYFRDATLDEIGRKLGLSKSWLSRLHARTLEMIRDLLGQSRTAEPALEPTAPQQQSAGGSR
jgi:RNA polymerase sigma factor for flagellar operon FliA